MPPAPLPEVFIMNEAAAKSLINGPSLRLV